MAPQLRLPGEGLRSLLFQRFLLCAAPSIAIAPRGTHGHNFTQVSSKLMCTTTCPRAACPSKKLFHCQVAVASDIYLWSPPELPKRPTPGPRIAPTFWALLLKETKEMVSFWRPESGHHFSPGLWSRVPDLGGWECHISRLRFQGFQGQPVPLFEAALRHTPPT